MTINKKSKYKHVWNGIFGINEIAIHIGISSRTLQKYLSLADGKIDKAIELINASESEFKLGKKPKKREVPKPAQGMWSVALGLSTKATK